MLVAAKVIASMVTLPGIFVLLTFLGLVLHWRWRRTGLLVIGLSTAVLFVLSLPITAKTLLNDLEHAVPPLPTADTARQTGIGAIVVLGGGRVSGSDEYVGDTV